MDIGKNLRDLREKQGLSQTKFAELVEIKQCTLSQYERGTKAVPLPLAVIMAEILECEINDFLK